MTMEYVYGAGWEWTMTLIDIREDAQEKENRE